MPSCDGSGIELARSGPKPKSYCPSSRGFGIQWECKVGLEFVDAAGVLGKNGQKAETQN